MPSDGLNFCKVNNSCFDTGGAHNRFCLWEEDETVGVPGQSIQADNEGTHCPP